MSRERDSELIHELVTSKYKIAERNRLAKIKFLSNMSIDKSNNDSKRRDSEPSLAQNERIEVRPVDLSVPGTPVSSHYLASLQKLNRARNNIETDSEDDDDVNIRQCSFTNELREGLEQFTANMEHLKQQTLSHDSETKEEVDKKEILIRKDPGMTRVEQYFRDSARRGSLTRDFSEVVQQFDPNLLHENGKAGMNESKPGTPISSKLIKTEKMAITKLSSFSDNMKKLNSLNSTEIVKQTNCQFKTTETPPPDKPKRINPIPLTSHMIDKKDFLPISSLESTDNNSKECSRSQLNDPNVGDLLKEPQIVENMNSLLTIAKENSKMHQKEAKTVLKRNNSNISIASNRSDISVPGTPIDSRRLFLSKSVDDVSDDNSDMEIVDSSEVKALAQEFTEKIESLVHNTMDDEGKQQIDKKEKSADDCRVKNYFNRSEEDKSYQRTFSEIESFNVPPIDVKEKVEKYFKESEEKRSLSRVFSEAVNYIEPVDIDKLFKPGTPVSSKTITCLKKELFGDVDLIQEEQEVDSLTLLETDAFKKAHDALHNPPIEFKVNDYFEQSKERQTLKRDFSEVYNELGSKNSVQKGTTNPSIQKFFEESDAQKSFRRQFSEAFQTLPPRMKDILVDQQVQQQKSERSTSIFSAPPDCTDTASHQTAKKPIKRYGIDKYFATSLYRTAYHRNHTDRRGSEPNHRLAIVEDEYVFGETDALRSQVFQDDDETPIRVGDNEGDYEQQNVQFWRDFLKPYTLNLPTDIVMRDELIDKYTKYTLE